MEEEQNFERVFSIRFPLTYERLKRSLTRRANAMTAFPQQKNIWRVLLETAKHQQETLQQVTATTAVQVADEFGINDTVKTSSSSSAAFPNDAPKRVAKVWQIPGGHTMVLFQNAKNGFLELVWVRPGEDYSRWALNHNNRLEDPEEFMEPPHLPGDPTLTAEPLVASLEDPKRLTLAVILRQRDVLLFDHVKQKQRKHVRHWRQLLTDEIWEPRAIPVVACCFVLDSLLLFASADGILRAHPRNNPRSTYHVEDIAALPSHMVSLYNVVALVHSHHILEVRHVTRIEQDPFIRLQTIYKAAAVDSRFPPLLYGPYVIYQTLEGSWVRVQYDGSRKAETVIKIPYRAGWPLLYVKNANWRYMTVILRNPKTNKEEEYNV